METRLSRFLGPIAKRLVADAAQRSGTPAELCARLAEQIADGRDRQAFLRSCGTATTATMTAAAGRSASESGLKWDPALLVDLAEGLAAFVGPIARVVVNRAAKKARSEDELYAAVAEEIPDEADRKRFLAIRSRRQG